MYQPKPSLICWNRACGSSCGSNGSCCCCLTRICTCIDVCISIGIIRDADFVYLDNDLDVFKFRLVIVKSPLPDNETTATVIEKIIDKSDVNYNFNFRYFECSYKIDEEAGPPILRVRTIGEAARDGEAVQHGGLIGAGVVVHTHDMVGIVALVAACLTAQHGGQSGAGSVPDRTAA